MNSRIWENKRVLVLGMGLSGRSAVHFLQMQGADVTGFDRDPVLLQTHPVIEKLKKDKLILQTLEDAIDVSLFDALVISPGVNPNHPLVKKANQAQIPVIGEIELGCRGLENRVIGVTGTNGKTTVTLLVAHVLQCANIAVCSLGNIGKPLTEELLSINDRDTIVLELSSYQLETLQSKVLDSAVILNITPDHLDRYPSMESYAATKLHLFNCLKPSAHGYIDENAWKSFGSLIESETPRLYGYESDCFIYSDLSFVYRNGSVAFELPHSLKSQKSHELENMMAAFALCADFGVNGEQFLDAWKIFKKPSHRIEFVSEIQGVRYYDDSKGTNVDAVIRAVESLKGPIILIAGGIDKGSSYAVWLEKFDSKVKSICAIGQAADKIQAQLSSQIPVVIFNTLDDAVGHATKLATAGDCILLSPGCASFDMFKDYVHRGEEFQRIVREKTAQEV